MKQLIEKVSVTLKIRLGEANTQRRELQVNINQAYTFLKI